MQIRWSVPAAEDLERMCARIERDNPEAASRVANIIYIYKVAHGLKIFLTWGNRASAYLDAASFLSHLSIPLVKPPTSPQDRISS
jgi:hypothetical protein